MKLNQSICVYKGQKTLSVRVVVKTKYTLYKQLSVSLACLFVLLLAEFFKRLYAFLMYANLNMHEF